MSFLDSIFGGGKNPANAASPYMNQIAPMAEKNLQPWQNQGQEAQQGNQQQYNRMMSDPASFYSDLRATYKPSSGFEFKKDQMMRGARGLAAAGGRTNTPENEQAQMKLANDLLSQDENEYIQNLMGIHGMGLQGNENIAQRGFGAAGDLTNVLGTTLGNQGQLAFKGQENKNASREAMRKMLMQLAMAGVGGAVGGAPGAMIGANAAGGHASSMPNSQPSNQQQFYGGRSPTYGGNF